MHKPVVQLAAVAVSFAALGVAATAAPKPMELASVFVESSSSDLKLPKTLKACAVRITALVDERRSPELIGVHSGRAIHAPADRDKWLRSMVAALARRKIAVTFPADASGPSEAIPVDIALTKAWIANTLGNMSANIVFRLRTTDAAGVASEQSFRGGASHSSYFSNGPGELQRAFDTSISRGLDALASEIHKRCGNSVEAT